MKITEIVLVIVVFLFLAGLIVILARRKVMQIVKEQGLLRREDSITNIVADSSTGEYLAAVEARVVPETTRRAQERAKRTPGLVRDTTGTECESVPVDPEEIDLESLSDMAEVMEMRKSSLQSITSST